MHVRFSACIGTPILDDATDEQVALLEAPLIHPDLGTIEGFTVAIPKWFHREVLFLSVLDILHWGAHVRIRDAQVLGPLEERVRLQAFVDEGRTVIDQRIMTEGGVVLGTCTDIQFNTKTFVLGWLFPRKLFRWGLPVPSSSIIEVKKDVVMVKDVSLVREVEEKRPILQSIEELAKAPTAGMSRHL